MMRVASLVVVIGFGKWDCFLQWIWTYHSAGRNGGKGETLCYSSGPPSFYWKWLIMARHGIGNLGTKKFCEYGKSIIWKYLCTDISCQFITSHHIMPYVNSFLAGTHTWSGMVSFCWAQLPCCWRRDLPRASTSIVQVKLRQVWEWLTSLGLSQERCKRSPYRHKICQIRQFSILQAQKNHQPLSSTWHKMHSILIMTHLQEPGYFLHGRASRLLREMDGVSWLQSV